MTEEELVKKFESENITLAPISKRAAAFMIDYIIVTVLIFAAFNDILSAAMNDAEMLSRAVSSIALYIYVLMILYQAFFVYLYGATLGKMALKIKIISIPTGEKPNLSSALLRSVVRIISEEALCVGFLWAFQNNKRQTWQDLAAKTLVVNA